LPTITIMLEPIEHSLRIPGNNESLHITQKQCVIVPVTILASINLLETSPCARLLLN
jgi:hypothetical protein